MRTSDIRSGAFGLTDEQQMLQAEARALARSFSLDYWLDHDNTGEYPWEFVQAFADKGWLSIAIPEEYGGMGLGLTDAALLLHEVALSGAALSGASAIHFHMFPPGPIITFGSEAMKRKHLPALAKGEMLMSFGVTEPTAGTDTSRITTRAARHNGGWVINGQKVWTTNAQNAQKLLLLVRTEPRSEARPLDGMTLFFTDLDRERCTVKRIPKLGRAAVDSNELFIENLEATDDDIVGEIGRGFHYLLDGLNRERVINAVEAIGIGRAALNLAVDYANQRVVFDRQIGVNQAIAHPLADAWARMEAAELLAYKAAHLFDTGQPCGREANAAKYLATDAAFKAADAALQTHGGFGYAKEYHVERLWREVRLMRLAPISNEMVLNYVSHKVLGLPKSY